MNEYYKEISEHKTWQDVMLMYGISSKFMIIGSFSFSNHHATSLPNDFVLNDGNIGLHTHGIGKGHGYAYSHESYALGFRYRFFNRDGDDFRQREFQIHRATEGIGRKDEHRRDEIAERE